MADVCSFMAGACFTDCLVAGVVHRVLGGRSQFHCVLGGRNVFRCFGRSLFPSAFGSRIGVLGGTSLFHCAWRQDCVSLCLVAGVCFIV